MDIRKADNNDAEGIRNLHLQAFDRSESGQVADLAVNLLGEKSAPNIISLVAIDDDEVVGHVAFSPVFSDETNKHFGYILAPLAVLPTHQKRRVGSSLVKHGLEIISSLGRSKPDGYWIFVYGDPEYYSRFGFDTGLARSFKPPYTLEYPEGWQAMKLGSTVLAESGTIRCVESLNSAELW